MASPLRLKIEQEHWIAMRRHVMEQAPLEACGLLAGKGESVQAALAVRNAANSSVRFRMDPQEQWQAFEWIEEQGLDLVGIFHSHPAGPETASVTDIAEAAYDVVQVIWAQANGVWTARGFWIEAGQASEVALQVLDGSYPQRGQ
ncbi:MAG: M67 family metallopeptidase [Chloroflexota bacterium]